MTCGRALELADGIVTGDILGCSEFWIDGVERESCDESDGSHEPQRSLAARCLSRQATGKRRPSSPRLCPAAYRTGRTESWPPGIGPFGSVAARARKLP